MFHWGKRSEGDKRERGSEDRATAQDLHPLHHLHRRLHLSSPRALFLDKTQIQAIVVIVVKVVKWNFHDVVFGHPNESLHSPIHFGFRPISLGAVISICWCILHSYSHLVTFNYYRLIIRFCPSWSVIDCSTTMTSADFSRQVLLRGFRKTTIRHVRETSSDKGIVFPSYAYFIYIRRLRIAFGLWFGWQSHPRLMPYMKFLYVRPDVCRGLPSDSFSRWTPLPVAIAFPLFKAA